RFQLRDPRIEGISWALRAEMESGFPNGRLYIDSLATALGVYLVNQYSTTSIKAAVPKRGGISGHRLKRILTYIEDNLSHDLSLETISGVAGLSISHCKTIFRNVTGIPIHQYVIQRRVERAKALLLDGNRS